MASRPSARQPIRTRRIDELNALMLDTCVCSLLQVRAPTSRWLLLLLLYDTSFHVITY